MSNSSKVQCGWGSDLRYRGCISVIAITKSGGCSILLQVLVQM